MFSTDWKLIYNHFFRPSGMLVSLTYGTDIHIKGYITLVLMHSGIVNGHQLLCNAHNVLEPHKGTAAFFLFYSLSFFSTFSFYVFVTLDRPFLGCLYWLC